MPGFHGGGAAGVETSNLRILAGGRTFTVPIKATVTQVGQFLDPGAIGGQLAAVPAA